MDERAKDIVVFGIQYTMRYIHELYQEGFFSRDKSDVINEAKKYFSSYLGVDYDVTHFEKLHDLGYLPIHVKGIEEGTIVKEKIPILTIYNTHPDFFWLPNFLETLLSSLLWKPLHSASLSYGLRKILDKYVKKTDEKNIGFVDFQGHDFSFRGMQHPESAISSGLGFLVNFSGTDTLPTLPAAKHYYDCENVGFSVPASEHSVMTAYGKEDELKAFKRIIRLYPSGIVSVVSDSFDLWSVCTEYLPALKEEILARDGKLVIRPDSGDPVDIICGINVESYDTLEEAKEDFSDLLHDNQIHGEADFGIDTNTIIKVGNSLFKLTADVDWNRYDKQYYFIESINIESQKLELKPSDKGVIELLWDVFGGTINEQGYKVLDSHIGAILGDGVTLERAEEICKRLESKGFASTNIVLGIGSYSMGYCTRDNQGSAMKATYVELTHMVGHSIIDDGGIYDVPETIGREIFKDPITDDGTKKSATGLLQVVKTMEQDSYGKLRHVGYQLNDKVSWEKENTGELKTIYKDGEFDNVTTLTEIRNRLKKC
jgi:nicotinamide phosphoribosyltransferase